MFVSTSTLGGMLALAATSMAASMVPVTNFGTNPTGVLMNIYVPDKVAASPSLILGLHWCQGSAQQFYTGRKWAKLADSLGYILLIPESPRSGKCWDVHSAETLVHDKGGDSLGVASGVRWASAKYNIPKERTFAVGESSGAMLTNVMMGAYPDLFAGGASFSGVPYGCFAGSSEWSSPCAGGTLSKTAQAWGDMVRSGYPGFSGKRPSIVEWHGTADTTLSYKNLAEDNKQWPNVFGISFTRNETNTPLPNYTKMVYGDGTQYLAYSAGGVGHSVPQQEQVMLDYWGVGKNTGGGSTTTMKTSTTSTKATSTSATTVPTNGATVAKYGQCGGSGYTGPTVCESGSTCTFSNTWYSQCL